MRWLFIFLILYGVQSCGSDPSQRPSSPASFGTYTDHRITVEYVDSNSWAIPKNAVKPLYEWSKADFSDTISLHDFEKHFCIEIVATVNKNVSIELAKKRVSEMKNLLEATIGCEMTAGGSIPVFKVIEGYVQKHSPNGYLYLRLLRLDAESVKLPSE